MSQPDASKEPQNRFASLPERVPPEDLVAEKPAEEPPDPDTLVEPTGDWMHRPH